MLLVKVWVKMRRWKASMILCFSLLCILHSKDSSVQYKNWKTQKNSWKSVRPKKTAEILQKPKKNISKICQHSKNAFDQFADNKKIGRASLSEFWHVSSSQPASLLQTTPSPPPPPLSPQVLRELILTNYHWNQ